MIIPLSCKIIVSQQFFALSLLKLLIIAIPPRFNGNQGFWVGVTKVPFFSLVLNPKQLNISKNLLYKSCSLLSVLFMLFYGESKNNQYSRRYSRSLVSFGFTKLLSLFLQSFLSPNGAFLILMATHMGLFSQSFFASNGAGCHLGLFDLDGHTHVAVFSIILYIKRCFTLLGNFL